mmetsp:Transcript_97261/g.302854  ORF Transcript_97261/g.302854 Transcript_97261/m.302854 type:complete len:344 (-) Transcript_97261:819-1850(-)
MSRRRLHHGQPPRLAEVPGLRGGRLPLQVDRRRPHVEGPGESPGEAPGPRDARVYAVASAGQHAGDHEGSADEEWPEQAAHGHLLALRPLFAALLHGRLLEDPVPLALALQPHDVDLERPVDSAAHGHADFAREDRVAGPDHVTGVTALAHFLEILNGHRAHRAVPCPDAGNDLGSAEPHIQQVLRHPGRNERLPQRAPDAQLGLGRDHVVDGVEDGPLRLLHDQERRELGGVRGDAHQDEQGQREVREAASRGARCKGGAAPEEAQEALVAGAGDSPRPGEASVSTMLAVLVEERHDPDGEEGGEEREPELGLEGLEDGREEVKEGLPLLLGHRDEVDGLRV